MITAITIKLSWWMLPLAFALFPFLFAVFYKSEDGYFPDPMCFIVGVMCWLVAIAMVIGHFI